MFRRHTTNAKSRFEELPEFQAIRSSINQLRKHKDSLSTKPDDITTLGKITRQKHLVLEAIIQLIDTEINKFNQSNDSNQPLTNEEGRQFILNLFAALSTRDKNDVSILAVRRKTIGERALATTSVATRLTFLTGMVTAPLYFFGIGLPATMLESILGVYLIGIPTAHVTGAVAIAIIGNHDKNLATIPSTQSNILMQKLTTSLATTYASFTNGVELSALQEEADAIFNHDKRFSIDTTAGTVSLGKHQ